MKRKILALSLLSVCCVGLFVTPAKAWLFSPWHCHNRYTTQITCRPYNAFTPICWGNLVCDGCCPSPCGVAGGCLPMPMPSCGPPQFCGGGNPGMGIPYMGDPNMGGGCGPGGCCASDMPMQQPQMPMQMPMQQMPMQMPMQQMPMQMPMQQMPDGRSQPYMGPMPNVTMGYPLMQQGVAQANYYPSNYSAAYPSYYPYYPMPTNYNPYPAYPSYPTAPMPYYWYGAGR